MSDRFVIIDKGRLPLPAKCWCCGAGDRDCVDWGADIQFQGAVLICVVCLAEAATVLPQVVDNEKVELRAELAAAKKAFGEIRGAVDALFNSGANDILRAGLVAVPEFAGASTLRK